MKGKKVLTTAVCLSAVLILLFVFGYCTMSQGPAQAVLPHETYVSAQNDDIQKLSSEADELILRKMKEGMIPGLSAVIVRDGEIIYKSGFGYADLGSGTAVTADTLFQLGSNSKAFTALGVLQLQEDGLIDLSDPITKYIPWLQLIYDEEETVITIDDFLHHTSGIPSSTIVRIPELDEADKDAIEKTVREVAGLHLVNKPGVKYEYATINYDVLGHLIEVVSGMKYEEYMQMHVLDPAGLHDTYMYREQAEEREMASGYKIGFYAPRYYNAPRYAGNKPAGYIISCANDMAQWLKLQMGTGLSSLDGLVAESHMPDLDHEVLSDDVNYGAGWFIYGGEKPEIFHGGRNPNFSSYIVFRPEERVGVAVLCNIKSDCTPLIAESLLTLFDPEPSQSINIVDSSQSLDKTCVIIILVAFLLLCGLFVRIIFRLAGKKQTFSVPDKGQIAKCVLVSIVFLALGYLFYVFPYLFLYRQTWHYIFVWYPVTIKIAVYFIYACLALLYINIALRFVTKQTNDES